MAPPLETETTKHPKYEASEKLRLEAMKSLLPAFERLGRPLVAIKSNISKHTLRYLESPNSTIPANASPEGGILPYTERDVSIILRLAVPFKTDELISHALPNKVVKPEDMESLYNHYAILHVLFRIEITCNTFRILRYSLPLSLHYDGIIYLCHNYEFKRQKIRDVDPSVVGKVLTILKRDLGIEPRWKWMWWWDGTDRKDWESSSEYTHDDDIYQKDDF